MHAPDDYPFDARGPVGRYWLVHGVGFTVCRADGRKLGVVEDVVVDPVRQYAERLIVRRRRVFLRRRKATFPASAIAAVAPGSQRFLVASARGASAAPVARAIRCASAAALGLVREALRRLAGCLVVAGRLARRGASAGTRAVVVAARRARREAPRLESWLSAHAHATGRATATFLRFLGRSAFAAAARLGAAALVAARVLGDLAVLAAVLAAAAWRKAAARSTTRTPPPDEHEPAAADPVPSQSGGDADAPLSRETSSEVRTTARAPEEREPSPRHSTARTRSDRRSEPSP
jgi:hypothetical protein